MSVSSHPGRSGTRGPQSWPSVLMVSVLMALFAVVAGLWIVSPSLHWVLELRMMRFIIPSLLRPDTGFLSLVTVIFLFLWVGYILSKGSAASGPVADASQDASGSGGEDEQASMHPPQDTSVITVPLGGIAGLSLPRRHEAARALGLQWSERFTSDDEAWTAAYEDALHEEALHRP